MASVSAPRPLEEADDRHAFDCGVESLNEWFRRHAWNNHVSGASRVTVLADRETNAIAAYMTLSSAQIEREFLPKPQRRNNPDPLPVTLLGRLAVHSEYRGQGHAGSLMIFALQTAWKASRDVGSFAVITHPLDDSLRDFYRKWGFEDLPHDPRRAMIVRMADLERSGIGS